MWLDVVGTGPLRCSSGRRAVALSESDPKGYACRSWSRVQAEHLHRIPGRTVVVVVVVVVVAAAAAESRCTATTLAG